MEYRVLEGIFENNKWKSIQILIGGEGRIYDRGQVTLDFNVIIISTDNYVTFYDIDKISGIEVYYDDLETLLEEVEW